MRQLFNVCLVLIAVVLAASLVVRGNAYAFVSAADASLIHGGQEAPPTLCEHAQLNMNIACVNGRMFTCIPIAILPPPLGLACPILDCGLPAAACDPEDSYLYGENSPKEEIQTVTCPVFPVPLCTPSVMLTSCWCNPFYALPEGCLPHTNIDVGDCDDAL